MSRALGELVRGAGAAAAGSWNDARLPERLAERLAGPLPGWRAQRAWEPELSFGRHQGPAPAAAQAATVVALLTPRAGQWALPLIVRPATMPSHAGQVGLPGGRVEPGETPRAAALRELREELGVPSQRVQLLGPLSPLYLFATGYAIVPWVAAAEGPLDFRPDPREVAALVETSLVELVAAAAPARHRRATRGVLLDAPHLTLAGQRVWGATAMILGELLAVLDDLGTPPRGEAAP